MAARKDLHVVVRAVGKMDRFQSRHRPRASRTPTVSEKSLARTQQARSHHLEGSGRHARRGGHPLRHIAERIPRHRAALRDRCPKQFHAPRGERMDTQKCPHQSDLPEPLWPNKAIDSPGIRPDRNIRQDRRISQYHRDMGGVNRRARVIVLHYRFFC